MYHKAKKSLGQNFLKSKRVLDAIVLAGEIQDEDIVLEVGPGKGALTSKLLSVAKQVIAVEKDDELFVYLQEKYATEIQSKQLTLIHGDILEFSLHEYIAKNKGYKVIANIPYNITGLIIRKFLEEDHQPKQMVLLVQKEVSDRIVARDHKESILSISVKAYGTPKYIMKVPAKDFSPAPKVDSAILQISTISNSLFQKYNITPERFFEVIKASFAHKRKVLIKNLESVAKKESIKNAFETINLDTKTRSESLAIETWCKLTQLLS